MAHYDEEEQDLILSTYDGYDGVISYPGEYTSPLDQDLTVDEKKELADYMIVLWKKYRNLLD